MLFVEARPFAKLRPKLMTDDELEDLMAHLAAYPNAEDALPGA